jgi:hypothetical protein
MEGTGIDTNYDSLLGEVAAVEDYPGFIFPDDRRFFNPPSMLDALQSQLRESGQEMPEGPGRVAKIILDSLAFRYASVLQLIEALTGKRINGVHVIGGGSQNAYLNQATANATGLSVLAGPSEATVIGNLLVQAISAGQFASLAEAREFLSKQIQVQKFGPEPRCLRRGATPLRRNRRAVPARSVISEQKCGFHYSSPVWSINYGRRLAQRLSKCCGAPVAKLSLTSGRPAVGSRPLIPAIVRRRVRWPGASSKSSKARTPSSVLRDLVRRWSIISAICLRTMTSGGPGRRRWPYAHMNWDLFWLMFWASMT